MIERMLVPTDFSEPLLTAVRYALELADAVGGKMILLHVVEGEKGICATMLGDDPEALVRALQDRFSTAQLLGGDEEFEHVVATVVGCVEAPALRLDLPLDVQGTAVQQ
jgi:nucleotide-binding universal stress UspA family protein